MEFPESMVLNALTWALPVLFAVTLHEAAHGYAARIFGDTTAERAGRVSLNPLRHVDPFGTVVLPGMLLLASSPMLFGYAKPVPVNFSQLRPQRLGAALVAFAGPATNMALALISALLLYAERWVTPEEAPWLFEMIYRSVMLNCVLAVFNLLPVMPLDGGRILNAALPRAIARMHARTERYGMVLIFGMLLLSAFLSLPVFDVLVGKPAFWLLQHILWLTGNGAIG